jgi:hypothetical protein
MNARPQPNLLPQEKEQQLRISDLRTAVRQIQSLESSKRRQTILLLPGEKAGLREDNNPTLRGQSLAVGLVITVPAAQGSITRVYKQKIQRRRFNVTVAKHHVDFVCCGMTKE